MQPNQVQLIDCVVASLEQYLEPELQSAMAQSQLLTVKYLLHQLRLRVLHEAEALADYEQDLRRTLETVRDLCADGHVSPPPALRQLAADIDRQIHAAEPMPTELAGVITLHRRTVELRGCLDHAVRAIGGPGSELGANGATTAAWDAMSGCITRHFEREARWFVSDYSAPRR